MTDSTPLETKVANWLSSQGYPLEMLVTQAFGAAGFQVVQSEYYSDPETKTSREIDVVASIDADADTHFVRVSFVIECKTSREKPWVVFTSTGRELHPNALVAQRSANLPGRRLLTSRAGDTSLHANALFNLHGSAAHGVTQAFASGSDAAYVAVHSAAKASVALALNPSRPKKPLFQVLFPVVVLDAPLFECALNERNEMSVKSATEGTFVWRNPIADVPHTIIDIVTLAALFTYVNRAMESAKSFLGGNDETCRSIISNAKTNARLSKKFGWVRSW